MPLGTTLARAGLLAGVTLALALPFVAVAAWFTRDRRWKPILLVAALTTLDAILVELPRVGVFRHLHWSWQESLLTLAWPFLLVAWMPGMSLDFVGVTSRFLRGWLRPSLVAGLIAIAVPGVFFALGARKTLTVEGWVFLSLMPGLAEELVFRGVFQSLLNRAFGKPWRLAGAEVGWGLVVTTILFAGFNGLVDVDAELHARIRPFAAIAPVLSGLVSGWVRERTNSVWMCVLGHNLTNLVIPLASRFV